MDTARGMGTEAVMPTRRLRAVLLAGTILYIAQAVCATLVTPVACAPSGVRVREKPSLLARRLYTLRYGQRLRSSARRPDGWYEVTLRDGRHGFSCAELLHEVTPDEIEFTVRFMDVPGGEATVINVGDTDVLIDGGSDPASLLRYLRDGGLVRGPLELAIVTHRNIDHWNALRNGLPFKVLEFWVPDRDGRCDADARLEESAHSIPGTCVIEHSSVVRNSKLPSNCRARENPHHHGNEGAVDVRLPFAPEVDLTILRTNVISDRDCESRNDDSSLVFMATIGSSRFLFTSDLRGKSDGDADRQDVKYGEKELIDMTKKEPDLLIANVLKVAHHGADTSTMPGFLGCVFPRRSIGPKFAVICSAQHMKQDVVVKRCQKRAVVLSTDERSGAQKGDIVCVKKKGEANPLDCTHEPRLYRLPLVQTRRRSSSDSSAMECVPCQSNVLGRRGPAARSLP